MTLMSDVKGLKFEAMKINKMQEEMEVQKLSLKMVDKMETEVIKMRQEAANFSNLDNRLVEALTDGKIEAIKVAKLEELGTRITQTMDVL